MYILRFFYVPWVVDFHKFTKLLVRNRSTITGENWITVLRTTFRQQTSGNHPQIASHPMVIFIRICSRNKNIFHGFTLPQPPNPRKSEGNEPLDKLIFYLNTGSCWIRAYFCFPLIYLNRIIATLLRGSRINWSCLSFTYSRLDGWRKVNALFPSPNSQYPLILCPSIFLGQIVEKICILTIYLTFYL